jgi:rare lipoprotein A
MPHSRRFGRRHAAISLMIGMTAMAILVGCQRLTPASVAATDVAAAPSTSTGLSVPSSILPFERLDLPSAPIAAESIWTAPPIESYAFETVNTAAAPAPAPEVVEIKPAPEPEPAPREDAGTLFESGIASTYGEGDGFQGNRTACGQRFDTNVPQVAHKSLPCGTLLRVEDAGSGKSVVVQVTDRGPYVKGRIVDLSWAAFSQLHPKSPDLLNVNVYVLGKA